MSVHQPGWASHRDPDRRRRQIRYAAAAASAATALLYFGIGAGMLKIGEKASTDAPDLLVFGAAAGAAFVLGTVLLLALDHRGVWLLGAILQVLAIAMYVAVSPQRTPQYEGWGILMKVLQVAILAALAYLVVRQPVRRGARAWRPG
jgi:hypothetical protein